jgi:X-X-X-Leu-X-X-Gly heptad repeat protein
VAVGGTEVVGGIGALVGGTGVLAGGIDALDGGAVRSIAS